MNSFLLLMVIINLGCNSLSFNEEVFQEFNLAQVPNTNADVNLNTVVDLMLAGARIAFSSKKISPLKDINKEFGSGFFKGKFQATGGYFKDPTTLHRTGDAKIAFENSTSTLQFALGLSLAQAGFPQYTLDIVNTHEAGAITVSIAENSLIFKGSFSFSPKCKLNLDYVKIDKLTGLTAQISGLGPFQSLFDQLSNFLIQNLQEPLINAVNKEMYEKLNEQVSKYSDKLCSFLPNKKSF